MNANKFSVSLKVAVFLAIYSLGIGAAWAEEGDVLVLNSREIRDQEAQGPFIPGSRRDNALVAMLRVEDQTGEMKHVRHVMYFVIEGHAELSSASGQFQAKAGDVLMVKARTPHRISSMQGEALIWLAMYGEPIPES